MAIKSGNSATASDMNALKTALLTLYANRPVTVNNRKLSTTTAAPYSTVNGITATRGNSIAATQKGIIDGVLVINDVPNLLTQAQNGKILADGVSSTDLLSWVNQYKNATQTSTSHGCRGACVGICSGGCANVNKGSAGGNCSCSGCTTTCASIATGGNFKGASGCNNTCLSTCGGTCAGTCAEGCSGCGSGCGSGCYYGCSGACQDTCKDGCATDCTSGCYGTAKSGTYT